VTTPDERRTLANEALRAAIAQYNAKLAAQREAESIGGRHYTEHVGDLASMVRDGQFDEAERRLLAICDLMEREQHRMGVAPWYYERLAIMYRKQKRRADEIAILERYFRQRRAGGAKVAKLAARLEKLKQ